MEDPMQTAPAIGSELATPRRAEGRARRPAPTQAPMVPHLYTIERTLKETHDTFTFELEPVGGNTLTYAPGQFNMLYAFGVGEAPISISGDSARPETLVHTIREVGIVTQALRKLKRGDVLGVRGPFGSHWPVEEAEGNDLVIVAGGIGLAPLRPVI